ncbi:MAG: alpha/beta hydrolase [Candidatus Melainabacteria bacterium]|nr:alpha/beta hydrolase [Candidatus Melainabacteria bacterium]
MILNYYERGNKNDPLVLFIHGSASDATVWLNEVNILAAKGYYCIAFDLRGHGDTRLMIQPKAHVKIDIDSHIQDVKETLKELGIAHDRKITFVTHSFGGLVAVNFAERYPARVDRLVLVCLPPKLIFPISTFLKVLLGKPLEFIQANLDFFQQTRLRSRYKSSILTNAHVLQEIYKHVKTWNSYKKVPRLVNKIYFAAGRFDLVAPAPLVYRLHQMTIGSDFEHFKWSGHALMEDEPEKFQAWLLKCVSEPLEPAETKQPKKQHEENQDIAS